MRFAFFQVPIEVVRDQAWHAGERFRGRLWVGFASLHEHKQKEALPVRRRWIRRRRPQRLICLAFHNIATPFHTKNTITITHPNLTKIFSYSQNEIALLFLQWVKMAEDPKEDVEMEQDNEIKEEEDEMDDDDSRYSSFWTEKNSSFLVFFTLEF